MNSKKHTKLTWCDESSLPMLTIGEGFLRRDLALIKSSFRTRGIGTVSAGHDSLGPIATSLPLPVEEDVGELTICGLGFLCKKRQTSLKIHCANCTIIRIYIKYEIFSRLLIGKHSLEKMRNKKYKMFEYKTIWPKHFSEN